MTRRGCARSILAVGLSALFAAGPAWPATPATAHKTADDALLRSAHYTAMDAQENRLPGPLLFSHRQGSRLEWGVRPLVSMVSDGGRREFNLLYPLLTHRSSPGGSHGQLLQFIRWSSRAGAGPGTEWMVFPLVAYQSATPASSAGFALFPLYGSLRNFFGQERLRFTLFPVWLSLDRRGVTSRFVLWPFVGWYASGPDAEHPARGWKAWPFYGTFAQEGVREDRFILWPFYIAQRLNLDTDAPLEQRLFLPFYSFSRTPDASSTWWGVWPLTVGRSSNRATNYSEWWALWPLIQVGRGDQKTVTSVLPFYRSWTRARAVDFLGVTTESAMASRTILWPVYRHVSETGPEWRRERTRLLLFLYSDVREQRGPAPSQDDPAAPAERASSRRIDLWPLFTYNATADGAVAFQTLALVEAVLNTEAIKRNYSPLWSVAAYRRDAGGASGLSLLWGLVQWRAGERERSLRLFYLPRLRWVHDPAD
ncbi:MAG: hypothetical protein AB1515_07320 [Nitrospirota bacterium]